MKQTARTHPLTIKRLAAVMVGLNLLAVATPVLADERDDQIKRLLDKVEKLEQRLEKQEAKAAPAPTTAATPSGNAGATSGFSWRLYGRADAGYTMSKGYRADGSSFTTNRFNQGQMASRLGISASWQFDPTLKAIFGAEAGTNLFNGNVGGGINNSTANCAAGASQGALNNNSFTCTGSSALVFNRGYTVGLASTNYGSLEAGTMYMAPFWVMLGADNASGKNFGLSDTSALFSLSRPEALGGYLKGPVASTANKSGTNTLGGANTGTALFYANSLRYRTPTFNNVSAELSYSTGQGARGDTSLKSDGETFAVNVMYKDGPLFVGYGHMDYKQVNDIATTAAAAPQWSTRRQTTDILGARYKWGDLTLGGAYTTFKVSNAGGYKANSFGLSGAYDIGKHRLEASWAQLKVSNATASGAYGTNSGAAGAADPKTTAIGLGYLYSLSSSMTLYASWMEHQNNAGANLGVLSFRGDNDSRAWNKSPSTLNIGSFFVF